MVVTFKGLLHKVAGRDSYGAGRKVCSTTVAGRVSYGARQNG